MATSIHLCTTSSPMLALLFIHWELTTISCLPAILTLSWWSATLSHLSVHSWPTGTPCIHIVDTNSYLHVFTYMVLQHHDEISSMYLKRIIYLICMNICMYVCAPYECNACRVQKNPLELKFQAVVSCHLSAEQWTQVLLKGDKCSQPETALQPHRHTFSTSWLL